MAEADIFQVIEDYRREVNRNELTTLRQLTRLWVPSYNYLKQMVADLTAAIQAQKDKGEPVWIGYVHSLDRYKRMMDQTQHMIWQYNRAATGQINGAEAEAVDLGTKRGQSLVNIAEPDDPMWTRVNKRETRITAGMLSEQSPLSELLSKSWPETKSGIEQALITGISTGQGSAWIAEQMMQAVAIPQQRALLIARTEVNRVYRQANLESMRESRAVLGYRRMCYPPTACFACLMMDGEYYDKDEAFSDHPNGKCSAVPVTRHFDPANDKNWERGQDWFARQDEATQRKLMGPGRFDFWKQQGVNPRDMVWIKPNKVWGGSPAIRPLEDLKSNKKTLFLSTGEHARLYKQYPNTVAVQALDAPGFKSKFENITGNTATDEAIYKSSVEILENCNGTENEELHLIDMETGVVFYKYTKSDQRNGVHYDDDLLKVISDAHEKGRKIVAVHNHPNGLPPTLDDGSSALNHGYDLGIAVGHNLEAWSYGKTNQLLQTNECEELHNVMNKKLQFMVEFDDREWYNLLMRFGMKVKRL